MSHEDAFGPRWFGPGGGRWPPAGGNDSNGIGVGGGSGGGEYYEYWYRSGSSNQPRPCPPAASNASAECERLRAENSRLLAETERVTAEATRVAAEAVRLEAENTSLKGEVARITSQAASTAANGGGLAKTPVISERVGSVTQEFWAGMSESGKKELDDVLKRIVVKICPGGMRWEGMGTVIREELSTVGLRFATGASSGNGWGQAKDANLPEMKRITSLLSCSVDNIGTALYPDEMIRIVKRLLELRGFPA